MARIAGTVLPDQKRVTHALTAIFGVGLATATAVVSQCQIDPNKRAKELSSEEVERMQQYLTSHFEIEGTLRTRIGDNIKRMIVVNSRRGIRHQRGLPVRGQHTRTNSRTRKGKKMTVATGRKAPAAKT